MNTDDAIKSKGVRQEGKELVHMAIQLPLQGIRGLSNLTDRFYLYTVEVQLEGHRLHKLEVETIAAKSEADQEYLPQLREVARLNRKAELAEQLAEARARLAKATAGSTGTTTTASGVINPLDDASAV